MILFRLIRQFQKLNGRSPTPGELQQLKKQADKAPQPSNILPFKYKKSFGDEVDEMIERGEITIGTAPKTTKKKAAVDPKFERAVKAQDERSESFSAFKKRMEDRNKEGAFQIAFNRYKDVDKIAMPMGKVLAIYKNLAKYPKGRNVITQDIDDIQKGLMFSTMGNRSRQTLVNDLQDILYPKKQSNPFEEVEVSDQLQFNFDDLDPKGMAGGGLAYMLGYSAGGLAGLPPVTLGLPTPQEPAVPTPQIPETPMPQVEGKDAVRELGRRMSGGSGILQMPFGRGFGYGMGYGPDRPIDYGLTYQQPGGMGEGFAGGIGFKNNQPRIGMQFRKRFSSGTPSASIVEIMSVIETLPFDQKLQFLQMLPPSVRTEVEERLGMAKGGRIGFSVGGFNKARRAFLKLMGGVGAGIGALKMGLLGGKKTSTAVKVVETVKKSDAKGMPEWFPKLVERVMKEGDDVTDTYGTIDRTIVKKTKLPDNKTDVIVEVDLASGDTVVDIGMGKHGWVDGHNGQPARIELRKGDVIEEGPAKGKKEADEFSVEEAEFTGDGENVKYEDSSVSNYGEHGSDFTEVEKYATGKNVDQFNIKGTKKREAQQFAEGRAEMQAEEAFEEIDEFASGGLAKLLGE